VNNLGYLPNMKTLTVTSEGNYFKVYLEDKLYSEIVFNNNTDATLTLESINYQTSQDDNKNIVLSENGKPLFTFKFDKLWGGAEIVNAVNGAGLEIKGRWFKIGTRLIDENDNDLVVVVNGDNGYEVTVNGNDIDPLMIISTVYYHIYATRGKLLGLVD
jgi:hypothetical protein